jgi:hypothetical protein
MGSFKRKRLEAEKKRKKIQRDLSITGRDHNAVNRQCLKKKTYSTLRLAEKVVKDIKRDRESTVRAYECNICGFYHLTHRK